MTAFCFISIFRAGFLPSVRYNENCFMQRRLLLLLTVLLVPLAVFSQKNIRLKGSNSILPLGMKLASEYMKKNAGSPVAVSGGGSGIGISSMMQRNCEIAMASRPISTEEKNSLDGFQLRYKEKIIALDGIVVIVNKDNPVNLFTKEQLAAIYTGAVKNWKELGGADAEILVYSRLSNSGTHSVFAEKVMGGQEMSKQVLPVISNSAIVQYVRENKNAIGFACFAYVENRVKICGLSWDQGKTYILPDAESIRNNSYPMARPLYFYYLEDKSELVKPFLDFLTTSEGIDCFKSEGYFTP